MADQPTQVHLPEPVEEMLRTICREQSQSELDALTKRNLASLEQAEALKILGIIRRSVIKKSLNHYINFLIKKLRSEAVDASPPSNQPQGRKRINQFPQSPLPPRATSSPSNPQVSIPDQRKQQCFSRSTSSPSKQKSILDFFVQNNISNSASEDRNGLPSATVRLDKVDNSSPLLEALHELDFKKAFLFLSYIGRHKLEDVASVEEIRNLHKIAKSAQMAEFESHVWSKFGHRYCDINDRVKHLDWHRQRTYLYHCHVYPDGSYRFKGPYLSKASTLLHKVVGDQNVLTVKFLEEETRNLSSGANSSVCFTAYNKIIEEGIFVGLKRYRFFVFKDGGREEKKKNHGSPIKCYFIDTSSWDPFHDSNLRPFGGKTMHDFRCIFMHIHNVSSLSNYMSRFSLILSKTTTLDINMDSVCVTVIDDVLCQTEDGTVVKDKDGKVLIHTDGTGFISEDLALKCPQNFYRESSAACPELEGLHIENCPELCRLKSQLFEPPLLIQFRMFHYGQAVKGTVLINRQLRPNTIQVRPSMIKVKQGLGPSSSEISNTIQVPPSVIKGKKEPELSGFKTVNSFEIVGTSNKPKKPRLSKSLIAILSYGGVPKEFFMDVLKCALLETQGVLSNKRAALRVALIHGEMDNFAVARMILSGIPLEEPFLQHRLSYLANEEKKNLRGGKLPIAHSFFLMGTADPTGTLCSGEVCVILENGQIFGKVLVYRYPGSHFGDIHVVNAVPVKDLGNIIGNSKYGIFFPAKGPRSLADEIAGGDYDGDMYWVSQNPQLLKTFKPSEPWTCIYSSPTLPSKKPSDIPPEKLEQELFDLFLAARFRPSKTIGIAADSWLVYMDRILTLQDDSADEKNSVKRKMLELVDIYYDALDAAKKGKKVEVPDHLIPKQFPHHMEKSDFSTYNSTSILGLIYDEVMGQCKEKQRSIEIWKLPCFESEVPYACLEFWEARYKDYRGEMSLALRSEEDSKSGSAAQVFQKYQKILYDADELDKSEKAWEEISAEALAIYRVAYDYAIKVADASKCCFAWRVAGQALVKIFMDNQGEKPICCAASVLREMF